MTEEQFEEKAEKFRVFLEQLGYTRLQTGRWIVEVIDDGQGFPYTEYTCPFCQYKTQTESKYCPHCGSQVGEEE